MKGIFTLSLLLIPGISSAAMDIPWESDSDPIIMSTHFQKKFTSLPLTGNISDELKFWSGDYWALKKGNINYRWYAKNKIGYNLNSPDKERARRMRIPELAELSPSEKYDLFTGRYDYPLRNEVDRIADKNAQIWEGICHGWSPATMNHNEPVPKLMTNPDGIEIPFGSTDIKALLSYYYAYAHKAPYTYQVGKRCFKGPLLNREKDCNEDLNAGAFHIILGNRIGLDQKGFIVDLQRFEQVWNHPVTGYQSRLLKNTGSMVELKTEITYVDENGHDWQTVIGTKKQLSKTTTYHYQLDLNSNGEITGGLWLSKDRPDFLWMMARPRQFVGTLSRLGELLED